MSKMKEAPKQARKFFQERANSSPFPYDNFVDIFESRQGQNDFIFYVKLHEDNVSKILTAIELVHPMIQGRSFRSRLTKIKNILKNESIIIVNIMHSNVLSVVCPGICAVQSTRLEESNVVGSLLAFRWTNHYRTMEYGKGRKRSSGQIRISGSDQLSGPVWSR